MRAKTIQGEEHTLIVLKVTERDAFGRPSKCDVGHDDTSFKLEGGEEFITAWVPSQTVKIATKGNG